MARRKTMSNVDILAWLITIPLLIIWWFMVEGYKYLILMFKLLYKIFEYFVLFIYFIFTKIFDKKNNKIRKNNVSKKSNVVKNNTVNNKNSSTNNNLRGLTNYDSYFQSYIRSRGTAYYNNKKIKDFKYDDNHVSAKVVGSKVYDSSVYFYKDGTIKSVSCTCPYFSDKGKYCKHLYAVLLEYSLYNKTYDEPDDEVIYDFSTYPDNDIDEIDPEMYEDLGIYPEEPEYDDDELKSFWGLSDEEANEVKKGNYDPWNFEEEDLEEDDYYYEDDE